MPTIRTALLAALLLPAGAIAADRNDLREFHIGMPVSALPHQGYVDFRCADDPARQLSGWDQWQSCPAEANGTHAVGFHYEDVLQDGGAGKTRVGGHPVTIALLIDNQATLAGIRIDTDPHTSLYMRKKAFLMALQVRARYGEEGWTCHHEQPTATEHPVGGVFIHEHCEKVTASRHFVLDRELFRDPSKDLRDFVNGTQLTIERPDLPSTPRE
ncbi:MAG: hypothetical protein B7Z80_05875 [Rhodospirillales bacterium 20-64-7]|nr:MAG: hypothetical protein B7Z80_05875 [Rhodospirillales bacterium 20-64-7]HQT77217.1 hypothetical protein [Rhodopila sp.]